MCTGSRQTPLPFAIVEFTRVNLSCEVQRSFSVVHLRLPSDKNCAKVHSHLNELIQSEQQAQMNVSKKTDESWSFFIFIIFIKHHMNTIKETRPSSPRRQQTPPPSY